MFQKNATQLPVDPLRGVETDGLLVYSFAGRLPEMAPTEGGPLRFT